MSFSVLIGWLIDKFSSGTFDFASCYRCIEVYDSGPDIPSGCLASDAFVAAFYFFECIFMFFMMTYKQSRAWRTWCVVTILTSIWYFIEIAYCSTSPVPNAVLAQPLPSLVGGVIVLMFTEIFHFRGRQLALRHCIGDDFRREKLWQKISNEEMAALQQFCDFTRSIYGFRGFKNSSPICQELNSIEDLYFLAHVSNSMFQDFFQFLASESKAIPESLTLCSSSFVKAMEAVKARLNKQKCTLVRGPVKRPDRAIAKVFRTYGGDVSKLTDLVRCSLMFDCFSDMECFAKALFSICCFGFGFTENHRPNLPNAEMCYPLLNQNHPENHLFSIERIRNRFDSSYSSASAYRDVSIKVTIGVQSSTKGKHVLVPVSEWNNPSSKSSVGICRNKSVRLFVCEVQLHHSGIQLDDESSTVHNNYVTMRNLAST
jgi:hypothetical protein